MSTMGRPPQWLNHDPYRYESGGVSVKPEGLKALKPHHEHMARLVACGATNEDLQRTTGLSSVQITRIISSPLFQALLRRLTGQIEETAVYNVRQELEGMANRAVEIISEDLEREATSHAERVQRTKVAFEVLDRTGYVKKEQPALSLHLHKHQGVDPSQLSTDQLLQDVLEISNG